MNTASALARASTCAVVGSERAVCYSCSLGGLGIGKYLLNQLLNFGGGLGVVPLLHRLTEGHRIFIRLAVITHGFQRLDVGELGEVFEKFVALGFLYRRVSAGHAVVSQHAQGGVQWVS